ncbi:MAG: hypothetical protein NVS9B10_08690 [Nevskia sp.]
MNPVIDIIRGRARDLGGFSVRRVLPIAHRKTIGPFIFFDEMGPAAFPAGQGMDVRPHPHIGLATVTYLFEGRIRHRDSLGDEHEERAVYVVSGAIAIDGQPFVPGELAVLAPQAEAVVRADADSRLMLLGGARLPEARHIWWNLVSTRIERIEQAKRDWLAYGQPGAAFAPVPDDPEFIPLPDA